MFDRIIEPPPPHVAEHEVQLVHPTQLPSSENRHGCVLSKNGYKQKKTKKKQTADRAASAPTCVSFVNAVQTLEQAHDKIKLSKKKAIKKL